MVSVVQVRIDEPEERLFRIGEVSRLTGIKAFVLRYWEQEIPTLQPVKTPTGHRLYRREDIETVHEIKRLLYEQGFTLAGARRHLAELTAENAPAEAAEPRSETANQPQAQTFALDASAPHVRTAASRPVRFSKASQKTLLELQEELLAILTLLERG
jgi:DNA-binding transcriptional MerR regulator